MIKLGILGSTRGTNLQGIIDAIAEGNLSAEIAIVISNKSDAMILERAREHGLLAEFIDAKKLSREEYDEEVSALLKKHEVDLIVLIGYMRILSKEFVTTWANKIINVHPSLLPHHAGLMDLAVHREVLENEEKETGCTVHYVTEAVDAGPIILQMRCDVEAEDTPETLKARVQVLESEALIEAIQHYKS